MYLCKGQNAKKEPRETEQNEQWGNLGKRIGEVRRKLIMQSPKSQYKDVGFYLKQNGKPHQQIKEVTDLMAKQKKELKAVREKAIRSQTFLEKYRNDEDIGLLLTRKAKKRNTFEVNFELKPNKTQLTL